MVLHLVCHVYRVSLRGWFKKPRELNALAVISGTWAARVLFDELARERPVEDPLSGSRRPTGTGTCSNERTIWVGSTKKVTLLEVVLVFTMKVDSLGKLERVWSLVHLAMLLGQNGDHDVDT